MKKLLIYVGLFAIVVTSCNKENYYQDSGTHEIAFDGNIMDYLDSKAKDPIDLFDTLVQVIRHAGMEEKFKSDQMTFFAVPDPSIGKSITVLNEQLHLVGQDTVTELTEVKPEVWEYFLSQYLLEGEYSMIDFPQVDTLALFAFPGQLYQSYNKEEPLNIGVVYHDLVNEGSTIPYKGYRQVLISHIPDFSEPKKHWINTFISSSDIKPTNGRVHVINYNKHSFGFDSQRFATMAREKGIDYINE